MSNKTKKDIATLLREHGRASGAMVSLAGGPSFYDAQKDRNEARDAILAATEAKDKEIKELREMLRRLCTQFPTDTDMTEAGWTSTEINEACSAYEAARTLVLKEQQ